MDSNEVRPEMHATTNLAKLSNKAQERGPPLQAANMANLTNVNVNNF